MIFASFFIGKNTIPCSNPAPFVSPNHLFFFFFAVALRPNAGHGLLILDVSRSHNDAPQSVGLLWTSDQLVAETST